MTNREWLNTLSDEELAEFIASFGQECVCCPLGKTCDGACVVRITDWLSQPHEPTADEDFAEIVFTPCEDWMQGSRVVKYHRNKKLYFQIWKSEEDGIEYWTGEKPFAFTDELIDQIRKIADKKRKEMGWK